jgi:isoquinoline 1-oxidoreductase alpha subunit
MPSLNVNGKVVQYEADSGTPLLWVLREQLGLTGTKYGCGIAQCGACTVLIDGAPVRSCIRTAESVGPNEKIVTIEGLSADGKHPVQKAWAALDVPQCGFCQSGMLMATAGAMNAGHHGAQIADELQNVCVCGTYQRIKQAVAGL